VKREGEDEIGARTLLGSGAIQGRNEPYDLVFHCQCY